MQEGYLASAGALSKCVKLQLISFKVRSEIYNHTVEPSLRRFVCRTMTKCPIICKNMPCKIIKAAKGQNISQS